MDLDQDGRSDILSGSWPGEIYFFRRHDDGTFAAPEQLRDTSGKPINVGSAASAFAVDWNDSGTLDLLIGNISGEVHLLLGEKANGQLAFGPSQKLTAGGEPIQAPGGDAAPVAADWDGDGRLDLIVGTEEGSVLWYRNAAAAAEPQLEAARTLIPESPAGWGGDEKRGPRDWGLRVKPCVVDWDGDGHLDILLGDRVGGFQAKPMQTEEEKEEERKANDRLPELRQAWARAFQEYQRLQAGPTDASSDSATALTDMRQRLARLKDEIARVQQIQEHYQPGYQAHGFVWLFLRQPATDTASP